MKNKIFLKFLLINLLFLSLLYAFKWVNPSSQSFPILASVVHSEQILSQDNKKVPFIDKDEFLEKIQDNSVETNSLTDFEIKSIKTYLNSKNRVIEINYALKSKQSIRTAMEIEVSIEGAERKTMIISVPEKDYIRNNLETAKLFLEKSQEIDKISAILDSKNNDVNLTNNVSTLIMNNEKNLINLKIIDVQKKYSENTILIEINLENSSSFSLDRDTLEIKVSIPEIAYFQIFKNQNIISDDKNSINIELPLSLKNADAEIILDPEAKLLQNKESERKFAINL